jgi:hypothetical protein
MKSLNECIIEYKNQLDKGDIQIAYKALLEYMMALKNLFKARYPELSVPGNIYQGYMDMTYFALFPVDLKKRKLKIAIVLIHDKLRFEIWLAGVNKQVQAQYWNILKTKDLKGYRLSRTLKGTDSIIEYELSGNPDFSDPEALTRQIEAGTIKFIKEIAALLDEN